MIGTQPLVISVSAILTEPDVFSLQVSICVCVCAFVREKLLIRKCNFV